MPSREISFRAPMAMSAVEGFDCDRPQIASGWMDRKRCQEIGISWPPGIGKFGRHLPRSPPPFRNRSAEPMAFRHLSTSPRAARAGGESRVRPIRKLEQGPA